MRWHEELAGTPVYDVQLLGFDTYEAAADEAYRLYGDGFSADILVWVGPEEQLE